jgi:hypothetical protein
MEQLTEKVYECNLAVEAHMICDILSQAGISARVDGEFLQSAAGEIPLGNTVKVRVDPSRAAEAREVISDWEKLEPPPDAAAAPAPDRSRFRSPLWFLFGAIVGATVVFLVFYQARTSSSGSDRNRDGRVDARWAFDLAGAADHYEEDNDFDGRPEQVWHYAGNVPVSADYYFASGGRVVKRELFKAGLLDSAEYDDDGDGRVERRVEYDAHAEPKM